MSDSRSKNEEALGVIALNFIRLLTIGLFGVVLVAILKYLEVDIITFRLVLIVGLALLVTCMILFEHFRRRK